MNKKEKSLTDLVAEKVYKKFATQYAATFNINVSLLLIETIVSDAIDILDEIEGPRD